jgi:hypothetical protein
MPSRTLGSIKVHTFDPPPAGFDPLQASARDLLRFGIPRRPDATSEPVAHMRWVQAFRRYGEFTHLVPEFEPRPDRYHGPVRRTEPGTQHLLNATSTNWSGVVAFLGAGDRFTYMSGTWNVPHVYPVPGVAGTQYSSAWLGLDGDGSADVMQAGTECDSDGTCQAWFEWFPDFEHVIPNLPVAYGDCMSLLLCNVAPDTASVSFGNLTSKTYVSFTFTAPAGTTLVGNCAEAIVEAPSVGGAQSLLPRYGFVEFNDVTAYSQNGSWPIGAGTPISMVDSAGNVISAPDAEVGDADSFVCSYTGQ